VLLYRHTDARSSNSLSMGETGQSRKVANRASMRTLRLWQRYVYATVTSMPTLRLCVLPAAVGNWQHWRELAFDAMVALPYVHFSSWLGDSRTVDEPCRLHRRKP